MNGCEDYLKTEDSWVHLRLRRQCGCIGCCDSSKNRHATKHYHAAGHPIMESYDPSEPWGWCYVDEEMLDFIGNETIHQQASSVASRIANRDEQNPCRSALAGARSSG